MLLNHSSERDVHVIFQWSGGREIMNRIAEGIRSACTEDGGVLLDIYRGKVIRLNPIGAAVFTGIESGQSEPALAAEIADRCGVDADRVLSDIRDFCLTLRQRNLIEAEEGEGIA
jgi:hypothetical protein